MKTFPAAQIHLIERPHAEPLYFAHIYIPGETLYFSDRNFKFNGHDYEAYLQDIPETVHSIEKLGGYLNLSAQLTFRNLSFRTYPRLFDFFIDNPIIWKEMDLFVLYLDNGIIPGTDLSTKLHRVSFGEAKRIQTETFDLELFSVLYSLDQKKFFNQINRATWPNAAPAEIGKFENKIIGYLEQVPCHAVDMGAVTTLASDVAAGAPIIDLSEVDGEIPFPSSGRIQIGYNLITYTGKNSTLKKLTGCTWANPIQAWTRGEPVWQVKSSYKYLLSDHQVRSIKNIYVAGVLVAASDWSASYNYTTGKTTISFANRDLLRNQGGHTHGMTTTGKYLANGSSWSVDSNMGPIGASANLIDQNEATYCHVGLKDATDAVKNASFTANFPTYGGVEPAAVYVCITCDWQLGFLCGEFVRLIAPQTISMGEAGTSKGMSTLRLKLSGTSVPTTVTILAHTNQGTAPSPCLLIANIYEIWIEIEYNNLPSGGENAAWTVLAPLVTADVEGYLDDGSGTYTGTPGALIQNPSDVRKYLLVSLGRSISEIDTSFATVRAAMVARIAGGYKIAGVLSKIGSLPSQIFKAIDEQTRSQMREDGGLWKVDFYQSSVITLPTSLMTIDKDIYVADPEFTMTPANEIKNLIRATYDLDYGNNGDRRKYGDYFGQLEVSDAVSIAALGELSEEVAYSLIHDYSMALDVAQWRLIQRKTGLPTVDMICKRRLVRALERGDYITLNDVPVAAWEGMLMMILEIGETPDKQQFKLKAIKYIGS